MNTNTHHYYPSTAAVREYFAPDGDWAKATGVRIRTLLEVHELTQAELAAVCDTSTQTISMIERGRLVPRDYLRHLIASVLGTTVSALWPTPTLEEIG